MTKEMDDWEKQVEKTEEGENEQADVNRFEITNYPADITLSGYRDQWEAGQIVVPSFQRKFVWDRVRASKLIESFLLGLPVPGIFLYKERGGTQLLVIDGQQRVKTIAWYFKGLFRDRKFTLKNVAREWNGKSFEDLSEQDQFKLSTAVMRATIIQQLHPGDKSSIYYVFERLNTGGVNLNPMEVRMCVAEGRFTKFLQQLNSVPAWRKLIQQPKEDDRARDIELILRVMALGDAYSQYEKPMKRFLNDYIQDNKNPQQEWMDQKQKDFMSAVERARLLTDKPFHLRGKLNFAALDSILVALMSSNQNEKSTLVSSYQSLVNDEVYKNSISQNTSGKQEIFDRIRIAKERFA